MATDEDPFEEESRRRAEVVDRTEKDRLGAFAAEEKSQTLAEALQESAQVREEERDPRLPPRIGAWEPGNSKQELQSLRFEIEAERALFLGTPVPQHDEKLKDLHQKLVLLHMAYQHSGDPSVLIGIADLKVRYEKCEAQMSANVVREKTLRQMDRARLDADVHTDECTTTTSSKAYGDCERHGWPVDWEEWEGYAQDRWGTWGHG
jgi:hypothetical protein